MNNIPFSSGQYAFKEEKEWKKKHFSNWDSDIKKAAPYLCCGFPKPVQTSFHQLYFLSAYNGNIIRIAESVFFLPFFHSFIVFTFLLLFCKMINKEISEQKKCSYYEWKIKAETIEWMNWVTWLGDESRIYLKQMNVICIIRDKVIYQQHDASMKC